MSTPPDQFNLDCAKYRVAHGSMALYPHFRRSTGKLYIVKSLSAEKVVLAEVFGDAEIEVTALEFSSDFGMWIQDEAVFIFGTQNQQQVAHEQWDRVIEAMKRILYARTVPMVV